MSSGELPGKGTKYVGVSTCFVCHYGRGRIFMAKRSQNARDERGTWETGAGGLDFGVKAVDNVVREIKEEFSAQPSDIHFLGYRDALRTLEDGTPTHWLGLDFLTLLDPKLTKINEPHKFDDSGWFEIDKLPSPLHSQVPIILGKYVTKLAEYGLEVPDEYIG